MTRLESAINYFTKRNDSPSGTLEKINAYKIAEKCTRDLQKIVHIIEDFQRDQITPDKACFKIEEIICN